MTGSGRAFGATAARALPVPVRGREELRELERDPTRDVACGAWLQAVLQERGWPLPSRLEGYGEGVRACGGG